MWGFLVTVWKQSYGDTPWWGIVLSLAVMAPFVVFFLVWLIDVPIGFLYALFIWDPKRDVRKREEAVRVQEDRERPEIRRARMRYQEAREAMMATLLTWRQEYHLLASAEDADVARMMWRMEQLWEKQGRWSPYAFWMVRDNLITLHTRVPEPASTAFVTQVEQLYQVWYGWMTVTGFAPRKTWDARWETYTYDLQ